MVAGRDRGRPRRRSVLRGVTALMAGTAFAACSSSSANAIPTLNFYQSKDNSGAVQQIIDNCNKAANGAYRIKYNFLPQSADGQRQELVRRLAAHDSALDIMAMDVVWAPEFAEAGWVKEWTGSLKDQAIQGTIPVTPPDRQLAGQAVRGALEQQHPAAVVPQGPGSQPAPDMGRDAAGRGQPGPAGQTSSG